MPDDEEPKFIDLSKFFESANWDLAKDPDETIISGLKDIGPITITGFFGPWMPMCGVCGERFALGPVYVTLHYKAFSVLVCPDCAAALDRPK